MVVGVRGPAVQSHLGRGCRGWWGEKCALGPKGITEPEGFPDPPAFTEHLLRALRLFGCWGYSLALDGAAPSVAPREPNCQPGE